MDQRKNYRLDEKERIIVRNPSAYWIPELTIRTVIHGTAYTVTGSYEGHEGFTRKLERILARRVRAAAAPGPDDGSGETECLTAGQAAFDTEAEDGKACFALVEAISPAIPVTDETNRNEETKNDDGGTEI